MTTRIPRRRFLRYSALGSILAAASAPSFVRAATIRSDKLNVALIGAAGKGAENLRGVSSENIVALCDVDHSFASAAFSKYTEAKKYHDFRKMLEKEKNID